MSVCNNVGCLLPGIIGEVEAGEDGKNEYYLWTHKKLDIGYNGDMVRGSNMYMYMYNIIYTCTCTYTC